MNLPELAMGIGIDSGEVVVGNIGSERRAKYSAVGSPINAAYRIESHTVGGQVLVSTGIYEKARSLLKVRGTVEAEFKGIDSPVTLYDIAGIAGKYQLFLPEKEADLLDALQPPLPIHCFPIEGKKVSKRSIAGHIVSIGASSAKVSLEERLTVHSNINILLAPKSGPEFSEVYAKVLSMHGPDDDPGRAAARIEFTWLPEGAKAFFKKLRSKESGKGGG